MKLDVVAYQTGQRARLARARAVHLHPTQLSASVVEFLCGQKVQIHAWDVNDEAELKTITAYGIPRICTDNFQSGVGLPQPEQQRGIVRQGSPPHQPVAHKEESANGRAGRS